MHKYRNPIKFKNYKSMQRKSVNIVTNVNSIDLIAEEDIKRIDEMENPMSDLEINESDRNINSMLNSIDDIVVSNNSDYLKGRMSNS
mmetsp:Transcript_2903/g.372  ORF Transcript_2903/g.372 Transcript_2903/m.372 type:complete len:87 (-) Transcript_2903:120-380(-)